MNFKLVVLFSVILLLITACEKQDADKLSFYKSQEQDAALIGTWEMNENDSENDSGAESYVAVHVERYTKSGEYHFAQYLLKNKTEADPKFYHDAYFYTKEGKIYFYHKSRGFGYMPYESSMEYKINEDGDLVSGGVFKKISD